MSTTTRMNSVLVALMCLTLGPASAWGFASWSQETDVTGYTHILNNPNDYPSWDKTNITYKFDPSFTTTWPNPEVKNQVRDAFNQWGTANATFDGSNYSYNRATGWKNFGDIRSVAVHELGHVLGIRHPNQAAGVARNWRPSGGTYVAQADNGDEVLRSWINPGDYNQVLSHDELDAFDYMYGHDLNFTEVSSSSSADIVIGSYTAGATNWAVGGWSGNFRSGDHSQGVRITSGFVNFNDSSSSPLGFMTLGINWDYENIGGMPTRSFKIRTTGTNNRTPLFHFDNTWPVGGNKFNSFSVSSMGSNAKDDLTHTWSNPASGDIPDTQTIHVGLEHDTWDWSVVSARVRHPNGTETSAPLISFHDWSHTVVVGTAAPPDPDGDGLDMAGKISVLARGFRIVASDVPMLVSELALAPVKDMGLMLEDLNRETMVTLQRNNVLELVDQFDERTIGPGEDFIIVLDGSDNLPSDILKKGNFLIMNRPDLLDQDLFVTAISQTDLAIVHTYALLGLPVNARVPEPATMVLLSLGAVGMLLRRRRR